MLSLKNLAVTSVATAPSPETSGTTLVVTAGHGARFPDPAADGSFPLVIWPAGADPGNAEIALCTARSSDTFTITRAQEGSTARTVVIGDQVMLAVTAGVWAETRTNIDIALFTAGVGR
jgi:hypothetical protein